MLTEIYGEALAALRVWVRGDPLAAIGALIWAVAMGAVLIAIVAIVLALGPAQ